MATALVPATRNTCSPGAAAWMIGLAGFAVSVIGSWIPSIATDEAATISAVSRSWGELGLLVRQIDVVHVAYYALMKIWLEVFGVSAVTLRLPSAILVGFSGVLTVWLAARWLPRNAALAAGALAVVLPRATHIGIEGRSWALVTVLVLTATIALVRWQSEARVAWLVGYTLAMGAGIVVEIYLVFVLVAHGIALLLARTRLRALLRFSLAGLAAVGLASPVIVLATKQTSQISGGQLHLPTWGRQLLINQTFAGEPLGPSGWVEQLWRPAAALLALGCWTLAVWGVGWAGRRGPELAAQAANWCLPLLLVPSTMVAIWSAVSGSNMYNPRYFSFGYAPMAILVVLGLMHLGRTRRVAVGLIGVLLVPGYVGQRMINAKSGADWVQVANLIGAEAQPGEAIFFAATPSTRPIAIAYPQPFEHLVDLTLDETPAASGTLSGTNRPLAAVIDDAPQVVWAVWRSDDDDLAADRQVLAAAGYQVTSQWQGSRDVVARLARS